MGCIALLWLQKPAAVMLALLLWHGAWDLHSMLAGHHVSDGMGLSSLSCLQIPKQQHIPLQ